MFEIWRHRRSGERYLVAYHFSKVNACAGPLRAYEDPVKVLETHSNQNHNTMVLLAMRANPEDYQREYWQDEDGKVVRVGE